MGVTTIGDLARIPLATLVTAVGRAQGRHLHDLAWGRDSRAVEPERATKSIGQEETYAVDLRERSQVDLELVRLADAVSARLRSAGLGGRTVTVKVRYPDFRTLSRSRSLTGALDRGPELAEVARELAAGVDITAGVRLLGVSVSRLVAGAAVQLELAGETEAQRRSAISAVDEVRRRYGDTAVGPASLLDPRGGLRLRRTGDQQWGPNDKG